MSGDREALRAADARARRLARELFDRPLVLEAGAGTGKTTALVSRILAWVLGPGWRRAEEELGEAASPERVARRVLRGVVAITFTEAAAAEMGLRVAEGLRALERGDGLVWLAVEELPEPAARCAERASRLRGALDHLSVQTIHAWCRGILLAHPLEAGLHPQLEIDAEQALQAEVVREVLEEALLEALRGPGDAPLLVLLARGAAGPTVEAQLLALLNEGVSAEDLAEDPFQPERVGELLGRARGAVDGFRKAGQGRLHAVRGATVPQEVCERLDRLAERLAEPAAKDAHALEALCDGLRGEWTKRHLERLKAWSLGRFGKGEAKALGDRCEAVAAAAGELARLLPHLCALDPRAFQAEREVLAGLLDAAERRLRSRGITTFSALLTGTCALFRHRPDVARRLGARIDQLLVDEFQDTDRRQCEMLEAVALAGPREGRPGLFLVGDPKQSIYGWRSADLVAYDGFRRRVVAEGGQVEALNVNFRSAPVILDEVERVVAPVMHEREGVQPRFQRLVPGPTTAGSPGFAHGRFAPTECWHAAAWDAGADEPRATRAGEASALEAAALAADLLELHREHGVPWKAVGVLFRGRADLEVYLAALRHAGIPYAVEGDRSYYQRREVIEAAALVRCVFDPNDALALLTVLRSSAVGVPDAALIPLWQQGFPGAYGRLAPAALRARVEAARDALPEDVPGLDRVRGWEENLLAAVEVLRRLRRAAEVDAVDELVEKLRRWTLFEGTEAARYLGAWRAANLDRFFRELVEQLGEGGPRAVLRRLRSAVLEEEQREEGRPRDFSEDAVSVMTIHGAKGLDFDHVYLMQLHKGSGNERGPGARARRVDGRLEYCLPSSPTPGFDRAEGDAETVAEAERVRALYVALTRARQRLVIAGLWREHQARAGRGQTIELVAQRHEDEPELAELMAAARRQGRAWVDAHDIRWLFPALLGAAAGAPGGRRTATFRPSAGIAEEAALLRAAREAARAREARPLGGAASAQAGEDGLAEQAERLAEAPRPFARRLERRAELARAVGTALHAALEEYDLEAEPAAELARQQRLLEARLRGLAPAGREPEALHEARALLERVAAGPLLARLRELAGHIVARELPLLAPAREGAGPVAFVAGKADLVYRDPAGGRLVVADYKTDRVDDPAALRASAERHREQGRVYCGALRDALGLDYEPEFELWYLRAGEIRGSMAAAKERKT